MPDMDPSTSSSVATQPKGPIKIGEILIERGVLSEQQVFEILQAQRSHGVPFGVLAERMFDVTVDTIEEAWVEQYSRLTEPIDLTQVDVDTHVLKLINRRQAWQFECLPLREEPSGELLFAATKNRLARTVAFVSQKLKPVVYFRLAESQQLRRFLQEHYPMPEVTQELLRKAKDMSFRPPAA